MAIKFFCDKCGKEMRQGMITKEEQINAVSEESCICSDCILTEIRRKEMRRNNMPLEQRRKLRQKM